MLTRGIQLFRTAWCVIGPTTSKIKHSELKECHAITMKQIRNIRYLFLHKYRSKFKWYDIRMKIVSKSYEVFA